MKKKLGTNQRIGKKLDDVRALDQRSIRGAYRAWRKWQAGRRK